MMNTPTDAAITPIDALLASSESRMSVDVPPKIDCVATWMMVGSAATQHAATTRFRAGIAPSAVSCSSVTPGA
jgi:hypothetical protein